MDVDQVSKNGIEVIIPSDFVCHLFIYFLGDLICQFDYNNIYEKAW